MAGKTGGRALANIYAQALYEAAQNAGVLEQVIAEVKSLRLLIQRMPRLERLLESPTIEFDAKRRVIEGTFKFSKVTQNFLLVLVERRRTGLFTTIVDALIDYSNRAAGLASVEVHSAQPLDEAARTQLTSVLSKKLNKKITLNEKVRPELIGGLVLQHEDKMWDRSVSTSLRRMIEELEAVKLAAIKWAD